MPKQEDAGNKRGTNKRKGLQLCGKSRGTSRRRGGTRESWERCQPPPLNARPMGRQVSTAWNGSTVGGKRQDTHSWLCPAGSLFPPLICTAFCWKRLTGVTLVPSSTEAKPLFFRNATTTGLAPLPAFADTAVAFPDSGQEWRLAAFRSSDSPHTDPLITVTILPKLLRSCQPCRPLFLLPPKSNPSQLLSPCASLWPNPPVLREPHAPHPAPQPSQLSSHPRGSALLLAHHCQLELCPACQNTYSLLQPQKITLAIYFYFFFLGLLANFCCLLVTVVEDLYPSATQSLLCDAGPHFSALSYRQLFYPLVPRYGTDPKSAEAFPWPQHFLVRLAALHSSIWHTDGCSERAAVQRELRRKWPITFGGKGRALRKRLAVGI